MRYLILVLTITATYLAAVSQPQQLTFEKAIEIGLKENIELKNNINNLYRAKAQKSFSTAAFLPDLSISGNASQNKGQQINQVTGEGGNYTNDVFRASISSGVVIFQGNRRINSLKESSFRLEAQEALVARSRQDIIYYIAKQYLRVLLDEEILKINEGSLTTANLELDKILGFVEVGSKPKSQVFTQEAEVKKSELFVLQAKNMMSNNKSELLRILQLDPSVDIDPVLPNWDIDVIIAQKHHLEDLYDLGLNSRSDLKQVKNIESANEYAVKGVMAYYMPNLSFDVSYSSQYSNPHTNREVAPFGEQFSTLNPRWGYGFSFRIPIINRLATKTSRINAQMGYESSKNNTDKLEMSIKIDINNAYMNFMDVKQEYEFGLIRQQAAELAYETQAESYNVGIASQVERAVAYQAYVDALSGLAQSKFQLLFQKIMLDYATGVLKKNDLN